MDIQVNPEIVGLRESLMKAEAKTRVVRNSPAMQMLRIFHEHKTNCPKCKSLVYWPTMTECAHGLALAVQFFTHYESMITVLDSMEGSNGTRDTISQ